MVPEEDSNLQAIELIKKDYLPHGDKYAPNHAPKKIFTEGSSPEGGMRLPKMSENCGS
jgi:hypothetical protein